MAELNETDWRSEAENARFEELDCIFPLTDGGYSIIESDTKYGTRISTVRARGRTYEIEFVQLAQAENQVKL
ncbi:MAG: hypothetical protein KKG75_01485 [Nanoarchaeota archaeon]|nr:hypothetical protein [Nanoarchaeota archaeon]